VLHGNLRSYWASVEALANALLQEKTLTEGRAFEIIEKEIPEKAKARAKAFTARDPQEVLLETVGKILKEQEAAKKNKA
jgi:hypothetical protein